MGRSVFNHMNVTLTLDCFRGGGAFSVVGDTALKALTTGYEGGGDIILGVTFMWLSAVCANSSEGNSSGKTYFSFELR